jgi:hypothetical protein
VLPWLAPQREVILTDDTASAHDGALRNRGHMWR